MLRRWSRPLLRALCVVAPAVLAACTALTGTGVPPQTLPATQAGPEVLGGGPVEVAMLLPRSGSGNAVAVALAFRNAAELALRDYPSAGVRLAVYDTRGTSDGAGAAADLALREGAQLVLGPVFAGEVGRVAVPARQAGAPVIAFSSDANVAAPGVYLLGFLPSGDVQRIVSYAAGQGRRSFAALLPEGAYGAIAGAAFRTAVAAAGGRVAAIETYAGPADIAAKAAAIARIAPQIDALLIPDGGDVVPEIAASLSAAGVTRDHVALLGSGQWDDPRILDDPALVGAWFPSPPRQGYETFAARYQAAYGTLPPRNATLAYDATVLAAGLARQPEAERFSAAAIGGRNGFAGLDGIFRFLPDGLSERRLAVFEVTGSGTRMLQPAARGF